MSSGGGTVAATGTGTGTAATAAATSSTPAAVTATTSSSAAKSKGGGSSKATATKASGAAGTTAKTKKSTKRRKATTSAQKKTNEANSQALLNAARNAQIDLAQQRAQTVARLSDPLWYRIEDILPAIQNRYGAGSAAATSGGTILPEQLQIVEAALGNNYMTRGDVTPQGMACLLEQARRYAQEILDDAMDYATHAHRMDISRNDILLAAEMRNDYYPSGNIITGSSVNSNTDGSSMISEKTAATTTADVTHTSTATANTTESNSSANTVTSSAAATTVSATLVTANTTSTSTLLSSNNSLALLPKLSLLSEQLNRSPLPPIPTHCYSGIVLPPKKHSLTARTYDIVSGANVATKMIQFPPSAPPAAQATTSGAVPSSASKPGYGATRGSQISIHLKGSEGAAAGDGVAGNPPIPASSFSGI